MLTKDLLLFRPYKGKIRPTFVDVERPDLVALASDLVAIVEEAVGENRETVEEALTARSGAFKRLKVAKGLCKLLLDRMSFEEPRDEVAELRRRSFAAAAAVLRTLPSGADLGEYESRLGAALAGLDGLLPAPAVDAGPAEEAAEPREASGDEGDAFGDGASWALEADGAPRRAPAQRTGSRPLDLVREALYADLPGQRRLLEWRALSPRALLQRYNMAQAQGLVLNARRLVVEVRAPELLRVRRVLRWLRFCRLVAQVLRHGEDWTVEIEGPAAILSMQKKYGLQLAMFLPALPVLRRFQLEAEIHLQRRGTFQLQLSEEDPLVSPYDEALGHIPPEIEYVARTFEDGAWRLDLTPEPRPVGPADVCVPDFCFRHRETGRTVFFELFHRWHHHTLQRRLAALRSRPDPQLFLGVDRVLARRPELEAQLEGNDAVMLFNGFPSATKIRAVLRRFESA